MAKQIDYPRASLKNSLELATAVDSLGGSCSVEMAAEKLDKKVSGAFQALVGSAVRYGLLATKRGVLEVTSLYRDHKLAYNKEEADKILTSAFLAPPLFRQVFDRFSGRELPLSHFEKLLIREFGIPDQISSRVSKYFLDGAKQCALLSQDNKLIHHNSNTSITTESIGDDDRDDESYIEANEAPQEERKPNIILPPDALAENTFSVRIKGPGMDSVITINDAEDILIVRAMLKKVEKKLAQDTEIWGENE